MRRIRPAVEERTKEFTSVILEHPIHEGILVGLTDDRKDSDWEEIPNRDGFFQVLAGFDSTIPLDGSADSALIRSVLQKPSAAVFACPFSIPDRRSMSLLVDRWSGP